MNLKALTQNELMTQTEAAIREERLSEAKVIRYFREIERRRSYLGYKSLFDLATKYFNYSAAEAQRRITTMRLFKDLPQYEAKLETGELNLTATASAQSYFRRSKLAGRQVTREEKIDLLESCIGKSTREVDKEIAKREPEQDKRQDVRYSSEKRIRISLNISEELYQTLEKLKFEYHASSYEEVIERLAGLKKPVSAKIASAEGQHATAPEKKDEAKPTLLPAPEVTTRQPTRHIPSVTKKIVIKTQPRKCCYKNPNTGEECNKTDRLEFDHIQPFSKGGPHLAENLRRLCSHHNKLMWQTEQKNL